ncbi:MAG: glucokinase [Deltaproteobacteria bacterium]|nr:glucokinase [Deltaproteobacteria bacterium]
MSRLVLAGDLGGTKANLALFEPVGGRLEPVREATLPSAAYASAPALVREFLGDDAPGVVAACLGIAGPVRAGRVVTPNLPWTVDARETELLLGLPRVTLINDLVATARGIAELPAESFAVLQEGRPDPDGNAALLAAGTGLGEALLLRQGGDLVASPSEGGHASFAPTTELEIELLRFLWAEHGSASAERVASGPGLLTVYRFLTRTARAPETPEVRARMEREDASAVVAGEALAGTDAACVAALDLWTAAFGAEAGNLALKALATAGVYVGGGIAPKILPKLREGGFLAAFRNKGRFSGLLADVPVRVILDPKAALYGAARCAAEEAARS